MDIPFSFIKKRKEKKKYERRHSTERCEEGIKYKRNTKGERENQRKKYTYFIISKKQRILRGFMFVVTFNLLYSIANLLTYLFQRSTRFIRLQNCFYRFYCKSPKFSIMMQFDTIMIVKSIDI